MNILFLMADEFRHDAAGFGGNPVARTPHLDRIAREALVFDNAYTPSPVCIPGRQCLATGRYPTRAGCEVFGEDIAPGSQTFSRWFTDHGYYTVACGKLHHRGPDQMQGWVHRIGSETAVRWPDAFGDRSQVGRRKWRGLPDLVDAGPGESPLGIHDDYTVRGACDFIRMHFAGMYEVPSTVPLFLMVSLQQPHFPLACEAGLFDYYHDRVPVFTGQPAAGHPILDAGRVDAPEPILRGATAAYYAMVEQTDRRFGQILAALEAAGQELPQWAIVFTSDHGEMLGEHGRWEKRSFYEGSARVPMFVRAPGVGPGRSHQPANLVDLFPTFCEVAGLKGPAESIDGRSLLAEPGDATFSQHQRDQFMVRSSRWKYLRLPSEDEVLFDLESDPGELSNVAANFPAERDALSRRLDAFLASQRANADV